ncbi:hypothetical protein MRX96_003468 [Rhipicephalus microplus]
MLCEASVRTHGSFMDIGCDAADGRAAISQQTFRKWLSRWLLVREKLEHQVSTEIEEGSLPTVCEAELAAAEVSETPLVDSVQEAANKGWL